VGPPVTSIAEAIARMQHIEAALPSGVGLACFNRVYLDVTRQVNDRVSQGFFSDPAWALINGASSWGQPALR
jgi:hypothetical protein